MIAGVVVLGAMPLTLVLALLMAVSEDGSRAAEVFMEAGPWGYAVVFATGVASAMAALFAGPADRVRVLGAGLLEIEPARTVGVVLLVLTAVLAVGGGAFAARTSALAGGVLIACGLLSAVALRTLVARSTRGAFLTPDLPPTLPDALEVVGLATEEEGALSIEHGDVGEVIDAKVMESADSWHHSRWKRVSVMAGPSLEPAQLQRVLQRAAGRGLPVELVGRGPKEHINAPPNVRRFLELWADAPRGIRLAVRQAGEACAKCTGRAKADGAGLHVTRDGMPAQKWTLTPSLGPVGSDELPLLDFAWSGAVEELVRAGSIAFTHGHALSLEVPPLE